MVRIVTIERKTCEPWIGPTPNLDSIRVADRTRARRTTDAPDPGIGDATQSAKGLL